MNVSYETIQGEIDLYASDLSETIHEQNALYDERA